MKVFRTESIYSKEVIFDVPRVAILNTRYPLYIAAREGQRDRVQKLLGDSGKAIGWWELATQGYIRLDGSLNTDAFLTHGAVFVAEPDRVIDVMRATYNKLVESIKEL